MPNHSPIVIIAKLKAEEVLEEGLLRKLRTSRSSAGNGRLGDAEKPDFQPLISG